MKLINILMYLRCFVGRGHWDVQGKEMGFLKLLGLSSSSIGEACFR